jgi:hypothetical protein
MSFPLENARSKSEWTSQVLGKENGSIDDVWHTVLLRIYKRLFYGRY